MPNNTKTKPRVTKVDIKGSEWKFLSTKKDKEGRLALPVKYSVTKNTPTSTGTIYKQQYALDANGKIWRNGWASSEYDMSFDKQMLHLRQSIRDCDAEFLTIVEAVAPSDHAYVIRLMARLRKGAKNVK